jgi:uncharacterized protein (DUF849 family)
MNPGDRFIINAAITGGVLTKKDSPFLPVTLDEIVDCARRVYNAGASIVHLHARGPDQAPAYGTAVYRELVEAVRSAAPELLVCVTLSGRHEQDPDLRAAALPARPDLASLSLGSMNFALQASVNPPEVIVRLARAIYAHGAVPELEVFDTGFVNYANYLIRKNVLQPPYYFNLIMGSLGTAPLDLIGLGHMIGLLPGEATWAVGGLGRFQLQANVLALAAGGHVRVGLEDNIHFDRHRKELADNVRLIDRVVGLARVLGREPASPEEARQIIGLPRLPNTAT